MGHSVDLLNLITSIRKSTQTDALYMRDFVTSPQQHPLQIRRNLIKQNTLNAVFKASVDSGI